MINLPYYLSKYFVLFLYSAFSFFKKTMYLIYQGSANQKIPYRFMLGTFLSEDIVVQQLYIQFLSCYPLFIEIYTSPYRLFTGDRLHH